MAAILRVNAGMKSSGSASVVGIGAAAAHFGLPPHVLRHWEAEGLLAPARAHGRRVFGDPDLFRIGVVLRAKEAGLSLTEIRAMVTAGDGRARREALRQREAELVKSIENAQASLDLLRHGLNCPHEDFADCPRFRGLIESRYSLK
jgi:DNA-binding transcriptional MerR regulator